MDAAFQPHTGVGWWGNAQLQGQPATTTATMPPHVEGATSIVLVDRMRRTWADYLPLNCRGLPLSYSSTLSI
jgi:hypothetical protein